jgi:LmbE family N-acetylglucosaminyl deacetylase
VDIYVLSPHLDDAVLSIGATIAREATNGQQVCVMTFFTTGPDPSELPTELRKFADYETRKREDEAACAVLGATPRWLGYVERIFREPRLPKLLRVFETPEKRADLLNANAMRDQLIELIRQEPKAWFYAPLGVGNHIDHVEVFVAAVEAMEATGARDRFRFYEDPYALGSRMRSEHFVTRRRTWALLRGPDMATLKMYGMFRVMASARKGPAVEGYLPEGASGWSWGAEHSAIGSHADTKAEAIGKYESQLSAIGGLVAWKAALRRYHEFWTAAEPLWALI